MPAPVIKTIDVPCTQEVAFNIFTKDFSKWWPQDKHSVSAMDGKTARSVQLELKQGGKITEVTHDGTELLWGSVTEWSPHGRLVIAWHINRPEAEATTVIVAFEPIASGTRVTLTHEGWEAMGDQAQAQRDGYNKGWVHVFETCFQAACAERAA